MNNKLKILLKTKKQAKNYNLAAMRNYQIKYTRTEIVAKYATM